MSLERDLQLWQQTGNSTHARNIANHLVNVLDQSKYQRIEKLNDVTVGHGSGAPIKSGCTGEAKGALEAMIANHEAECKEIHRQNAIMAEALQVIRTKTRREPIAGELANEALKKVWEGL